MTPRLMDFVTGQLVEVGGYPFDSGLIDLPVEILGDRWIWALVGFHDLTGLIRAHWEMAGVREC